MSAVTEAISEKPILFSGAMVRAILAGKKTQTRRIVKTDTRPQTEDTFMRGFPPNPQNVRFSGMYAKCDAPPGSKSVSYRVPCPYGWLGERLWVKETFWHAGDWGRTHPEDDEWRRWIPSGRIHFAADGNPPNEPNRDYPQGLRNGSFSAAEPAKLWRKMSSLHMRRVYSRLTLEITMIGVERLNDISEADAIAEGIEKGTNPAYPESFKYYGAELERLGQLTPSPVRSYCSLWESINGAGSWALNPYVWIVTFRKI